MKRPAARGLLVAGLLGGLAALVWVAAGRLPSRADRGDAEGPPRGPRSAAAVRGASRDPSAAAMRGSGPAPRPRAVAASPAADSPAAPPPVVGSPSARAALEGEVLLDGKPVRGASVSVRTGPDAAIVRSTDVAGWFRAGGLLPGHRGELRIQADGASSVRLRFAPLRPGEERRVRVRLVAGAALSIRVRGPDGSAVAGAVAGWVAGSAGAGARGDLREASPGLLTGPVPARPVTVRIRAPSASWLTDAALTLDPARGERVERVVQLARGGALRLRFVDERSCPVAGVAVTGDGDPPPAPAWSGDDGRATLGHLLADTTEVYYRVPGGGEGSIEADVVAGRTVEHQVVVAAPERHVAGRVVGADLAPLAGVRVEVAPRGGGAALAGLTGPDGRFRVELGRGAAVAEVVARRGALAATATARVPTTGVELILGGRRAWVLRLDVPAGLPAPLRVAALRVAFARAARDRVASAGFIRFEPTDTPGVFLSGDPIAAPSLVVLHPEGYQPVSFFDLVPVARDGEPSPAVPLTPGASLDGVVTDSHGAPIARVRVVGVPILDGLEERLVAAYLSSGRARRTGADGRFFLEDLGEATLVVARRSDGRHARAIVRAAPEGGAMPPLELVIGSRPWTR